jgi:hypothetical protein
MSLRRPSLTDPQRAYIERVANTLPFERRESFRDQVLRHLVGTPTIYAVEASVDAALGPISERLGSGAGKC